MLVWLNRAFYDAHQILQGASGLLDPAGISDPDLNADGMKKMLLLLTLLSIPALAGPSTEDKAVAAANDFVKLVDGAQFDKAYDAFSNFGQKAVTKEQFVAMMKGVQNKIGTQTSRKLKSKQFTHELPGAPKGDYWVIDYETNFSKKGASVERVTSMLEGQSWKVGGYVLVK